MLQGSGNKLQPVTCNDSELFMSNKTIVNMLTIVAF